MENDKTTCRLKPKSFWEKRETNGKDTYADMIYKLARSAWHFYNQEKSKGAQCSEPVKSSAPRIWFLWKV